MKAPNHPLSGSHSKGHTMNNGLVAIVVVLSLFLSPSALGNSQRDIAQIGPRTEKLNRGIYQKICYVSALAGSDSHGDGSKEKPWQTLPHALSHIADSAESLKYAVLVAEGIYSSRTLVMQAWVDLYGGFNSQTWARDVFEHRTVLDGERVRRVVVGANHARLDGFIIQNGLARTHGGGVLCDDTSPTISNNAIRDNFVLEPEGFNHDRIHQPGHDGGGIACRYNAVPVIRNNIISRNKTAIGNGGGIAFHGWVRTPAISTPGIKGNRLEGGAQPLVENNLITANTAGVNDRQRTRSSNGGGIACAFEARPVIRNNLIAGNQAKGRSDGGGIYNEYFSDPLIEANWIVGNVADDDAGGIYTMRMGHPLIQRNFIAGNWAPGRGVGGIRLSKEGRARIVDNLIVRNLSGGGVHCVDSCLELENNIIMHNQGGPGIGYETEFSYFMPALIRNNTVRENEQAPILIKTNLGQPLVIQNNNVQGGFEGRDNFDTPPAFARAAITGQAASTRFDPVHCTTTLFLQIPIDQSGLLAGRVICLGDRWSVIKTAESKRIIAWGDLSGTPDRELGWEIIPDYQPR